MNAAGGVLTLLSFYETVQKSKKFDEELRDHAAERWVACKERHARFLQQDGDKKGADAALAEVKEARQQLGMNPEDKLDELPKLDSLDKYLARLLSGEIELLQTRNSSVSNQPLQLKNRRRRLPLFLIHLKSKLAKSLCRLLRSKTHLRP